MLFESQNYILLGRHLRMHWLLSVTLSQENRYWDIRLGDLGQFEYSLLGQCIQMRLLNMLIRQPGGLFSSLFLSHHIIDKHPNKQKKNRNAILGRALNDHQGVFVNPEAPSCTHPVRAAYLHNYRMFFSFFQYRWCRTFIWAK